MVQKDTMKTVVGGLFSYHDTHLHRLGANYHLITVNQPKNSSQLNYQRDGAMRGMTTD
jgi:catalase